MPIISPGPLSLEPIELAADEAHAWAVPLDVTQSIYDELFATLARDERDRANDFRLDDPRRRFVIARGALRRLLGSYLDVQPTSLELTVDRNQKPQLAGRHAGSGLHFNVSHSGALALIAVAVGCEVGIDVEQVREVGHLEQIAWRFFHPLEAEAVLAAPAVSRSLAFLRCWTGKEAVLKALGTGILGSLADFQVPVGESWQGWVECFAGLPLQSDSRCWLHQLTPGDDYLAAIACVESQRCLRCFQYSW